MQSFTHRPGADAERAYRLGLKAATIGAVLVLGLSFHYDLISVREAFVYAVAGLPVFYISVACLLSVWLGYDKRL